ncbi:hypothetical protein [Sediminivirga luteola]|uniref:Antitoxin HicB n=1 Tax=Sediminivirga luteola TaxID=1774748 RepID=A0A8J2U155_9MICO|nr:hypothetical protein [Sediminivirga luteola]MCI2266113.1 hypothetical protein [Sediminivirga luteola]GGA27848.1 hypothetical protein GCM10011333_33310 [Sediminivirga luteola]
MTRYTVTATRTGRWWALQCDEVPGALSQAVSLEEAERIMPEAIAYVAGVPEDQVEVTIVPVIPDEARDHMEAAKRLREESARANRAAAEEARQAARALRASGLSVRDTGYALGVSKQRAAQLVNG